MLMYGCFSVDVYATRTRLSINGLPRGGQQSVARGSWPHYLRTGTLKTGNRMVRLIVEQVYTSTLPHIGYDRTSTSIP